MTSLRFVSAAALVLIMVSQSIAAPESSSGRGDTPKVEEILAARNDLLGDLARQQPNGASYEFFENVLPPLRYVDAAFHHYIIALSAPHEPKKGRMVSNGSGINLQGNRGISWPEYACPVAFSVGEVGKEETFGYDLPRLDGPRYAQGYLPIVELNYRQGNSTYSQQVFAPVESPLKEPVTILAHFMLREGPSGRVVASIAAADLAVTRDGHLIRRADDGKALMWLDGNWTWDEAGKRLWADLVPGRQVVLGVFSHALDNPPSEPLTADAYWQHQSKCAELWSGLVGKAATFQVPEARVNNAWRALLIGSCMAQFGEKQYYSAAAYYEQEHVIGCGDPVRAQMLYNFQPERVKPMLRSLLKCRAGPPVEDDAAHLFLINHYYRVTRDADFVRETAPAWIGDIAGVWAQRDPVAGLLPKERYNYDMANLSFTLHSCASYWRQVRDLGKILNEIGPITQGNETWDAARLEKIAAELRRSIMAAVEKSEVRNSTPPYVPLALFEGDKGYDALTATTRGSYWTIIVPYVLSSDLFAGTQREDCILDYLHTHGGICMGMMRFDQHSGFWCNKGLDDGFTTRYALTLLRRDRPEDVERAIVGFYGKLAQGMTRDTFISPEPSGLVTMDDGNPHNPGRPMFLPPITFANAFFQHLLRYMLIQDFDLDNDGVPKTLRLAFATPRQWMRDGASIRISRAPSIFGAVSFNMTSRLQKGEVLAEVGKLDRPVGRVLLRVRVPEGWRVVSAQLGKKELKVDPRGTVELFHASASQPSPFAGATVRLAVQKQ